jgi:superfamily II DNA helicase RecQ
MLLTKCLYFVAGKSVTFQLPPFTRDHAFTVVVSPLISLAKDQVLETMQGKASHDMQQ